MHWYEGSIIHLGIVKFDKIILKKNQILQGVTSIDFVGLWRGDSCTVEAIAEQKQVEALAAETVRT